MYPVNISAAPMRNSKNTAEPSLKSTPLMVSTLPPMIQIPSIQLSFPQTTMGYRAQNNYNSEFHMFPSPMSSSMDSFESKEAEMRRKVNVGTLEVRTFVSSKKASMSWLTPVTRKPVKFVVVILNTFGEKIETMIVNPGPEMAISIETVPGGWYTVHMQCKSADDRYLVAEWSGKIRAGFDKNEHKELLSKAEEFLEFKHLFCANQQFQFVYRCKPKAYWQQVSDYSNGIMQKYLKDESGHPGNRINGKIKGLFFSANTTGDGSMPQSSYFGNTRMACDAFYLLNPMVHNFYFADFYCNTKRHYVIVVVCVGNSESDKYCEENLIKLDQFRNEFLRVESIESSSVRWNFYVNKVLIVEIFYTEDVPMNIGNISYVTPIGAGESQEQGVPNNKNCGVCNM